MTGAMVDRDEVEAPRCTIRIGDGPEIPFDDAGKGKLKAHFEETLREACSRH